MSSTVIFCLSLYIAVSPLAGFWLVTRKQESPLLKFVWPWFLPGCLPWTPLAMIAATTYFWLYPERHLTTMDRHGTEEEKAALQAYRSALASETVWHRLLVKLGRRPPTAARIQAEKDMDAMWDRYQARRDVDSSAS